MNKDFDFARMVSEEHAKLRVEEAGKIGHSAIRAGAEFSACGNDRYRLSLPAIGVIFEVDRLRRERHELIGELSVRCDLPGVHTFDGILSLADLNFSSANARLARATMLAVAAKTKDLDWNALMEELCQRVIGADRAGEPALDLRDFERPSQDDSINIEGLTLPRRHPTIVFGDGGAAKSYLGLYIAGCLARRGMRVAFFDWELAGEDHRDRLERLFGNTMPQILYAKCDRPLVHEGDRLARIVRDSRVEYAIYDSVAFACDGPPEAAEVAGRYFRTVRQIGGGGSLHTAHVSKAEGADQKPFGSAFWHNGARSTWYAQRSGGSVESSVLSLGLFNRKANLGRLQSPIGFDVTFTEDRTTFQRTEVADNPDLAGQLSVRQRMAALLRRGAMSPEQIAEEIEAEIETVKRTARRYKDQFVVVADGKLGLLDRQAA